ncbi:MULTISPECIES: EscU/YscU/HrcU family type III secretion system export apparatus switch protein [unclassified Nitratiruptor]|uniref:EscU/YscU/HrcU family type III secretion system export apparatus switch protein n=1 Tax=unclassified Nitratiruptor TaxID=2624044 RepID=UPI001915BF33|nr:MULTISPECIES: EscU/YscU/HrcU family type III secretion system export apparatus switch protein [unclassified Nitratiruptor]BCD60071.1 flagellar biosynthesis protein [Nitratiruptor sp. YY08-10]BCD64440.1 flagellar biosynthesis protein [Nitratiruptor sp. YY08-14]
MKKKAVALQYDKKSSNAPKVIAKGEGYRAQKIIELAQEHGIELYEDPELIEVLSKVELDEEIPQKLYVAVAKILAYIYRKKKEKR